jgi:glutamate-1-semialdehyde 2,1-aminomutase
MEREKSWDQITQTGRDISARLQALAKKHNLPFNLFGLPALVNFGFPLQDALKYKTLITQEMLKKGFLASTIVFVCTEHTPELVDQYIDALDPVFALISECESGKSIDDLLEGPVCHAGFMRLN